MGKRGCRGFAPRQACLYMRRAGGGAYIQTICLPASKRGRILPPPYAPIFALSLSAAVLPSVRMEGEPANCPLLYSPNYGRFESPSFKKYFCGLYKRLYINILSDKKIVPSRVFTLKTQFFFNIIIFIITSYEDYMDMHIKRQAIIWGTIEHYMCKSHNWQGLKTVAVLSGLAGCGKTTLLLDYFKKKKHFYFSFAGLEENAAESLFTRKVSETIGSDISNWDDAFMALSNAYRYIIFDDLAPVSSYKRFQPSFYENMCKSFDSRPLVFFIAGPTDNLSGLADNFEYIEAGYFTVPEVMKVFSGLPKYDVLGVSAVSGGIPEILTGYDEKESFEINLRHMLMPDSAFIRFLPYLMEKYFRKPEVYYTVLYAIASGSHKVSEIGKSTGFAYNKCDNYLSALVSSGIIKAEKEKSKSGAEKTLYILASSYFRFWFLYVYMNRTELAIGDEELTEGIIQGITEKEIHSFQLQKAFAYVNSKTQANWAAFRISEKVVYAPKMIKKGDFSYTFDAIHKYGEKAVFVKVFADPLENCKRDELDKIQKAVSMVNRYYNSHVFLFTKRRFSDFAAKQAPLDNLKIG